MGKELCKKLLESLFCFMKLLDSGVVYCLDLETFFLKIRSATLFLILFLFDGITDAESKSSSKDPEMKLP